MAGGGIVMIKEVSASENKLIHLWRQQAGILAWTGRSDEQNRRGRVSPAIPHLDNGAQQTASEAGSAAVRTADDAQDRNSFLSKIKK